MKHISLLISIFMSYVACNLIQNTLPVGQNITDLFNGLYFLTHTFKVI